MKSQVGQMIPHTGRFALCSSVASIYLERGSSPLRMSIAAITAGFKEMLITSRRSFFGKGFLPMFQPMIYLPNKGIFQSDSRTYHF